MRPDVVLWNRNTDELFIFDAKKQTIEGLIKQTEDSSYEGRRSVIAQMHQYRDSIIDFKNQKRVIKGVYAIIPRGESDLLSFGEYKKFFEEWYRKKYGFGIYVMEVLGRKEVLNLEVLDKTYKGL